MKLNTTLWQHQELIFQFMSERTASLIGAGMGTGKTLAALKYVASYWPFKSLIVTTKRGLAVWKHQIELHTDFSDHVTILNGNSVAGKLKLLKNTDNKVVVVNYDSVWRPPLYNAFIDWKPTNIILDESHRVKAAGSKVSRQLHKLGKVAVNRIAMTGTPFADKPLDVFGQARFLNDTLFNYVLMGKEFKLSTNFNLFRAHYCNLVPIGTHIYKVIGYRNIQELQQRLAPIMLQIETDDVVDLPEAVHIKRYVKLSARAYSIYRELKRELVAFLDEDSALSVHNALVKSLRLQQITGGFMPIDGQSDTVSVDTQKIEEVEAIIEDLPEDEPVVIACKFTDEINFLANRLNSVSRLTGKWDELEDWQSGRTRVLLVQIEAGAESIDLTRAKYCLVYSTGYSLDKYTQFLARLRRPGADLSNKIFYYHILAENTIDDVVYEALKTKKNVNEAILEGIKRV